MPPHQPLVLAFVAVLFVCAPAPAQDAARANELATQSMQAFSAGEFVRARELAEEAIQVDPRCGRAYGARGVARASWGEFLGAIEDETRALELTNGNLNWLEWRARFYNSIDRFRLALDDANLVLRQKQDGPFLVIRGTARINLGEVDAGLADIESAIPLLKRPWEADKSQAHLAMADWQALKSGALELLKLDPKWGAAHFRLVRAAMETGQWDEARKLTESAESACPADVGPVLCRAWLHAFPEAKGLYDFDKALATIRLLTDQQKSGEAAPAFIVNTVGLIYFQSGRFYGAIQELATHGRMTNWETLFLLAASHFRVGQLAECRRYLLDARRLNPYVSRHAEKVPGLAAFLKGIDQEVARERKEADPVKLEAEQETAILSCSELETLVRRFQFERALAGYERYLGTLSSPTRRREAESRIADLKGAVGPFLRFREKLNTGQVKDVKLKVGAAEVTLTRALDDQSFEFSIPKGGGRGTWAALGPEGVLKLLDRASPTPEERLGMGILGWDLGLAKRAMEDLQRAVKEDKGLKARLDAFVAARRGMDIPEGGFVAHQGRFVTPEEKANLDKGLILFEGQWVTKADQEHLVKGQIQVGGKWVPGDEKVLLARGYKKYKGKWYTRTDYTTLRSKWENAHEAKTAHYDIRTNSSEEFAQELGALCEVAYEDFKRFYGGKEPKLDGKDRMTLYAFASYEDYRKYCVEHNAEPQLQAAGFATSGSNVVVGWNKTGEPADFLATMAGDRSRRVVAAMRHFEYLAR